MDFFEQQDQARKRSFWLSVLFIVAVSGVTALTCGVAYFVAVFNSPYTPGQVPSYVLPGGVHPAVLVATAVVTLVVILGATGYRVVALRRGGGESVALSLDAVPIDPDTTDLSERRLLNVVEEMAIASGISVPPVFVMEQPGINAFAAGYSPDDAVIGVTRGCIDKLSRDELQGVIAHEFSHIFNGDMKLNIRLIGIVFGLLVVGLIGQTITRGLFYSGAGARRRSSRNSEGGGALVLILAAVAITVIGYAGMLLARIIKSAISRQREYLADAAAVQFTRSTDGIAGALKKIGSDANHGKIEHSEAEEISHMAFANALSGALSSAFATHPPLPKRIKAIEPNWDGSYPDPERFAKQDAAAQSDSKAKRTGLGDILPGVDIPGVGESGAGGAGVLGMAAGLAGASRQGGRLSRATASIGDPQPAHVAHASSLLEQVPEALRHAAETPFGCRAVVFAMLLDSDDTVRQQQMSHLAEHSDAAVLDLTRHLTERALALPTKLRLPLLTLTSVGIRQLSPEQAATFAKNIQALEAADDKIDLFEWMLRRWARKSLGRLTGGARKTRVLHYRINSLTEPLATVVSALAYVGHDTPETAAAAFDAAMRSADLRGTTLKGRSEIGFKQIDAALEQLRESAPKVKKQIIAACAACVEHDQTVTDREAELLRGVADALDLPMPPVLN